MGLRMAELRRAGEISSPLRYSYAPQNSGPRTHSTPLQRKVGGRRRLSLPSVPAVAAGDGLRGREEAVEDRADVRRSFVGQPDRLSPLDRLEPEGAQEGKHRAPGRLVSAVDDEHPLGMRRGGRRTAPLGVGSHRTSGSDDLQELEAIVDVVQQLPDLHHLDRTPPLVLGGSARRIFANRQIFEERREDGLERIANRGIALEQVEDVQGVEVAGLGGHVLDHVFANRSELREDLLPFHACCASLGAVTPTRARAGGPRIRPAGLGPRARRACPARARRRQGWGRGGGRGPAKPVPAGHPGARPSMARRLARRPPGAQGLRKLANWSATPRSRSRSSAMTAWRSSRFLPDTRTWSAWMAAWTLSFASLMSRTISFALSCGIPCWSAIFWRRAPPAADSTVPKPSALSGTPRLWSRDWRMSTTARSFMSSGAWTVMSVFSSVTSLFVPLRS